MTFHARKPYGEGNNIMVENPTHESSESISTVDADTNTQTTIPPMDIVCSVLERVRAVPSEEMSSFRYVSVTGFTRFPGSGADIPNV